MKTSQIQNTPKKQRFHNQLFTLLTTVYIIVLLFLACLACCVTYLQRKESLLSEMDINFQHLVQEYNDTLDTFWQLYMPIYDNRSDIHAILADYFSVQGDASSNPFEIRNLTYAMQQMMGRNDSVQWIAYYSPERNTNYVLFRANPNPVAIPEDFPYLPKLQTTRDRMEVWGTEPISDGSTTLYTFALCGDVPSDMGNGKIIAGYNISAYEQICQPNNALPASLSYLLTAGSDVIFHSNSQYDENSIFLPDDNYLGKTRTPNGELLYVRSKISGNNASIISYQISWWDMFTYSHRNTPIIFSIVLFFSFFSIIVYTFLLKQISREVNIIRDGLDIIGDNHLDYQLSTNFRQSGLPEIAHSINRMSQHLKENIHRTYFYELRQKEAELSELQAKFNPHFLYNSLEMLRSRCYQNNDPKTADLITQLSTIFRGFIGSKSFIPLTEELAFSRQYLALFGARYEDQVQIQYDIDTELLQYGVIRHLFQPLIENYFVHGFDLAAGEDNFILFSGKSLDDHTMILSVIDNGYGMSDEELKKLNDGLQEAVKIDVESYGLKNLHQRLHLFYGRDCGLHITRNGEKGLCVQMTLLKMTIQEYEQSKRTQQQYKP